LKNILQDSMQVMRPILLVSPCLPGFCNNIIITIPSPFRMPSSYFSIGMSVRKMNCMEV